MQKCTADFTVQNIPYFQRSTVNDARKEKEATGDYEYSNVPCEVAQKFFQNLAETKRNENASSSAYGIYNLKVTVSSQTAKRVFQYFDAGCYDDKRPGTTPSAASPAFARDVVNLHRYTALEDGVNVRPGYRCFGNEK